MIDQVTKLFFKFAYPSVSKDPVKNISRDFCRMRKSSIPIQLQVASKMHERVSYTKHKISSFVSSVRTIDFLRLCFESIYHSTFWVKYFNSIINCSNGRDRLLDILLQTYFALLCAVAYGLCRVINSSFLFSWRLK